MRGKTKLFVNMGIIAVLIFAFIIQFVTFYQQTVTEMTRQNDFTNQYINQTISDAIHQLELSSDFFLEAYTKEVPQAIKIIFKDDHYIVDETDLNIQTSLSGIEYSDQNEVELLKSLYASTTLNKAFKRLYDNNDQIKWIYHVSPYEFINLYPYVSEDIYYVDLESFKLSFYQMMTEDNNPDRRLKWSPIYADQLTGENMVTIAYPMYSGNTFLGTLNIDYTNEMLSTLLQSREDDLTTYYLVNDKQEIIGSSDETIDLGLKVYSTEGFFGGFNDKILHAEEFSNIDTFLARTTKVSDLPVRLIAIVDLQKLYMSILIKLLPVLLFMIGGLVILNLYYRLIVTFDHLENSEKQFKALFNEAIQMFLILDDKLQIVEANSYFLNFYKQSKQDVLGQSIFLLDIWDGDYDFEKILNASFLNAQQNLMGEKELVVKNGTGEQRNVKFTVIGLQDHDNKVINYMVSGVDITEQINLQNQLESLSKTDTLTQINNRRGMYDILEGAISRYKRYNEPFSLLICDIDYFKNVNDAYGHECGDDVLKQLVAHIDKVIRPYDHVGRWGGEEFLIVLENTTTEDAFTIGDRVRATLATKPFKVKGSDFPLYINMTIGLAEYNEVYDIKENLSRADKALYYGKRNGRNQTVIYNPSLDYEE